MTKSLKCGKIREAHKASLRGKEERITNIVKLARPRNLILLSSRYRNIVAEMSFYNTPFIAWNQPMLCCLWSASRYSIYNIDQASKIEIDFGTLLFIPDIKLGWAELSQSERNINRQPIKVKKLQRAREFSRGHRSHLSVYLIDYRVPHTNSGSLRSWMSSSLYCLWREQNSEDNHFLASMIFDSEWFDTFFIRV